MYLERGRSVLEFVRLRVGLARQFAQFAYRHEAGSERQGNGRSQDKAASLDPRDLAHALVPGRQRRDDGCEGGAVGEQRSDVLEDDARLRVVDNVANG